MSETPEKSTTHSIFGYGDDDFGARRFDFRIPRLYINQRLARNTEKAILYMSVFCVGVRYEEEKKIASTQTKLTGRHMKFHSA